jgi:HlyD family secretion protein
MGGVWKVLKWVIGSFVILALVIGGAGVFLYPQIQEVMNASNGESGTEVRLMTVEPGRLVRTISAPGEIEPVRHVQISARISAQIEALPFEEGDRVAPGDIVVKLDDRDLRASLDSAQAGLGAAIARLSGAEASHINAVIEWERIESLYKTNDVSKADLDAADARRKNAESELNAAKQNVEAARADMSRIQENLRYAEIRSPIHGYVTKLNAEVGELVVTGTMNNAGTVIMEIADLSELIVKTEVDESDVAPVREGQTARIHINAYSNEVFEGVVKKVALQHSIATDRSKYYETEVRLIPKDERTIFSGLTANVDIEVETIEDVILAPSQAVLDMRVDELPNGLEDAPEVDKDKTFVRIVYRNVDGKAVATPVVIGASDLRNTAILSGLTSDDTIVVGPWATLQNISHDEAIRDINAGEDEGPEEPLMAEDTERQADSDDDEAPADSGESDDVVASRASQ